MSQTSDIIPPTRELVISSRCLFNAQFTDANTNEVVYSTRTPKVWFTRQSITSVIRHTGSPSTNNKSSGSKASSPVVPQPGSPNFIEKISVVKDDDTSSELTKLTSLPHYTPGDGKNEKGEAEITKIHWKCFHDTLFEQDLQTKGVSQLMEKSGSRPLRLYVSAPLVSPNYLTNQKKHSDRIFKVNGISYKWDLGLVGFDSPKVSTPLFFSFTSRQKC